MTTQLLHADEVAWLRQCVWPWSGVSPAGSLATQRARHGNRGAEPEMVRHYQVGDDVRWVDWPTTLRLQRAMVRQPQPMHHGTLRVVLDTSGSMTTAPRKWHATVRLTAALGVIAMAQLNRVQLDEHIYAHLETWLSVCDTLHAHPTSTIFRMPPLPFVAQPAVWCSDMWHTDWHAQLQQFAACTDQGVLLHILDSDELTPPFTGEITLIDSETHVHHTMTIDETMRQRYQTALQHRIADIQHACQQRAVQYLLVDSGSDVVRTLTEVLQ